MKLQPSQKAWQWSKVTDANKWKIPDGKIMVLEKSLKISKKESKILDLGCGIGRHTHYFSQKGWDIVGFDLSYEGLQKTKQWLKRDSLETKLIQGQMTKLPFQKNYFNLIIAFNVIYHANKSAIFETIHEIYRVLAPGGYFFGTFLTKKRDKPFNNSCKQLDDQTIIKYGDEEDGIPHFFTYLKDLLIFLQDFKILMLDYYEEYQKPFDFNTIKKQEKSGHYSFLVQKRKKLE
ncbi:MAG: class I SAM-dependent methyltransferase [Asgard group archaeon]|nr:class I SAM-dependent methyltransferase [Asgard group archaeon]